MRRGFTFLKEQRGRLWFAATVNLIVLCTLLVFFRPAYETNDDMAIALFVNGARGSYDAHLVYSNYLLGLVLSALYRFTNRFPWYSLIQYAVLFSSFTAIFYVVNRRQESVSATWVSVIVTWIFAYDGYIRIQYTKTAGIASAAGILMLLYAAGQKKVRKPLFFGYLLACLGFMYRSQQFLAELALMSGVGVFFLLEGIGKKSEEGRRLRRCIPIFVGLAAAVACLYMADRHAYRSQQWQDYLAYNELRTELLDYGFPGYEENKAAYHELGISRTAFGLYRGWNYADTEKFTPEVMRDLIALKQHRALNLQLLKDFVKEVPIRLLHRTSFCCLLMVLLYWLCCRKHSKSAVITVAYEFVLGVVLYFLLYYSGRYLYNRVDVGLWLAVSLVLLWTVPTGKNLFSARTGIILMCAAVILPQISWKNSWRVKSTSALQRMTSARETLESVASDKEHLYVAKSGTLSAAAGYGVFDVVPYGVLQNVLSLGGWPAFTAGYCDLMEMYGLTNPYRDMIGNDRLYLVDGDIKSTLKYIRKYYDKSAKAILVSEYPNYSVYRITTG